MFELKINTDDRRIIENAEVKKWLNDCTKKLKEAEFKVIFTLPNQERIVHLGTIEKVIEQNEYYNHIFGHQLKFECVRVLT